MLKKFAPGAAVALSAMALLPAVAVAKTQTASAKGVKATFSFKGQMPEISSTLTIARNGKVVYSHAVHAPGCGPLCAPGVSQGKSVGVLDLEHNGSEEVVLDLFSQGAHCCWIAQVFVYDAAHKTYRSYSHQFGNPDFVLADLSHNGRHEFVSGDDRFAYAFAPYAGSAFPIEVLIFRKGVFRNVTRSYPKLIAKDAAAVFGSYKQALKQKLPATGVIAAWAADEEELGHGKLVTQTLAKELKAGHLGATDGYPSGKNFISQLMKFLKRTGYTH